MKILKLEKHEIFKIQPLWEKLKSHHLQRSTYFKDHFESYTFEQRFSQVETKPDYCVFAAEKEARLTGYCIASIEKNSGEIDSIYVDPGNQNQKVGDRLIKAAESWLADHGISRIRVFVAEGNESVSGFYTKQGYWHRFTVFEKKM